MGMQQPPSKPKDAEKKDEKAPSKPKDAEKKDEKAPSNPKDAEKKDEKAPSKPKDAEQKDEEEEIVPYLGLHSITVEVKNVEIKFPKSPLQATYERIAKVFRQNMRQA